MNELKPRRHKGHGVSRRKLCGSLCSLCLCGFKYLPQKIRRIQRRGCNLYEFLCSLYLYNKKLLKQLNIFSLKQKNYDQ